MAARAIDIEAHAARREAFLDAAQLLIQTKGYEETSVQDILDQTGSSRGAFYHYFASKTALLEAVVERTVERALSSVRPLVNDQALGAVAKLEGLFRGLGEWKLDRTELMRALLRVWESDENALMREKTRRATLAGFTPLLAAVLRQGADESVFDVSCPDEAARILVAAMTGSREGVVRLFLDDAFGESALRTLENMMRANEEAFERVLGVEAGSLVLFDRDAVRRWFA